MSALALEDLLEPNPLRRSRGNHGPRRRIQDEGIAQLTFELISQHNKELDIDLFAGGGGTSEGYEQATGEPVDIAANHDDEALSMHRVNHPRTEHFKADIFEVCPLKATRGKRVRSLWLSPDCKDHSKAKGGPLKGRRSRSLAWVALKWAGKLARVGRQPRVVFLENVEEWRQWGPLVGPLGQLRRDDRRKGLYFRRWCRAMEAFGYVIEWRELRACDYGAPTIRKRLYIIARCDGAPIVWPEPTHGPDRAQAWRTAADCIDWSIPCPSIFAAGRDLAENTMARIAKGCWRYVIEAKEPFIVTINHGKPGFRGQGTREPFKTLTAARDAHGLIVPYLVPRYGERKGQEPRCRGVREGMPTVVTTANGAQLVAAFLAQHNGGMVGHDARKPVSTTTGKGCHQQVVATYLTHFYSSNTRGGDGDLRRPMKAVTARGEHIALVYAFLVKYFSTATGQGLQEPLHTVTVRDRFGLVTAAAIDIGGESYVIVDIGMRMLTPRELFRAQGFPDTYKIDPMVPDKRRPGMVAPLSKSAQIRMAGNSVCPPVARAIIAANLGVGRRGAPPSDMRMAA